jgi:7-cyano-7-deazaguanine synthase in queuosine biosynthesis
MTQIKRHQLDNNTLTGASFDSDIGIFDETKNYSSGDIVLWGAKNYRCVSAITGKTEGDLSDSPSNNTVAWTENKEDVLFSIIPSTAQSFTNTRITIDFDTVDIPNDSISYTSGDIVIERRNVLLVSVSLATRVSSGADRSGCTAYLQVDNGSGYTDVSNFEINMYNRDLNTGRMSGSQILPIKFDSGDKIRVQIIRYDGTNTLETIPAGCTISLYNAKGGQGDKGSDGDITWHGAWQNQNYTQNQAVEYNGSSYVCIQDTVSNENPSNSTYWNLMASKGDTGNTGPVGPSGDLNWMGVYNASTTYNINDTVESNGSSYVCINNGTTDQPPSANWELVAQKGVDGAGSSVTVQDSGINLPNTPHSTFNFTGYISAVDGGSGVANIDVPVPPIVVQYGMSTTQTVDATVRDVPFNQTIISDSAFSLNTSTGIITANRNIKILISYNIFMTLDSGDTGRNTFTAWIEKNGTKIDYSQTAAYTRGYSYNKYGNCSCPPTFVSLANGDTINVSYIRDDDINSPVIGSNQTWILIQEVK